MAGVILYGITSLLMVATLSPAYSKYSMVISILYIIGWIIVILRCKKVVEMQCYTGLWLLTLMGTTGILGPLIYIPLLPLMGFFNLGTSSMPDFVGFLFLIGLSLLCTIRLFGKNDLE